MKKTREDLQKSKEEIEREEEKSGKRVSGEPDSNLSAVGGGGIAGAAAGAAIGTAVGGPVGGALGAVAADRRARFVRPCGSSPADAASRRHTPTLRSASRSNSAPPLED